MIEQLHVKNFMTFEELKIPTLKRVNLIAGKNNSGKTALLEALRIETSKGEMTVINSVLQTRGAFKTGREDSYEALFNRNNIESNKNESIELEINYFKIERRELRKGWNYSYKRWNPTPSDLPSELDPRVSPENPKDFAIYVPFQSPVFETLSTLWDEVALTPKEDAVLNIIRASIEPKLVRFDVGKSQVRVRLTDTKKPVPLQTLGDGVQRIFLVALSLTNAKGKCLLIDEIESGLHYSVLEKLWGMIFKYALKWDIQVFVTTHSQDAIKAFYYVASQEKYVNEAEFIRLQINRKGKHEALIYDGQRLEQSLDLEVEIR